MRTRVIVPLDGSALARRAVPVAGWLARRRDAELVLVRVVGDAAAAVAADVDLEATLADAGLPGRCVVTDGRDIAGKIIAEANRTPGSIICSATHGGNRLVAAAPSATTTSLLRRARCPLVLVGPSCSLVTERAAAVVACLDGSERAERILPLVEDLASSLGVDVWLTQIVAPRALALVSGPGGDVDEGSYLARCARGMSHPVTNWDVLHGDDPAHAILDLCGAHPGTMPAIATHGRSGAQLVLHGSVALRVAQRCGSPVLVVPPDA
jgi:nucleotide-binding universal stress UspA family protein